MSYGVRLHISGERACFTRPEMKVERVSYDVMIPSAARGILEAIHWKPAIAWTIDRIQVLKPIRFQSFRRNEVGVKMSADKAKSAMRIRQFMCDNFYDIRAFGGVLSTGINAGQVRGPVQFAFGRSIEPILPLEVSITRMAATNEKERNERGEGDDDEKRGDKRTMGRKHIAPYGLYRAHGYVSAPLASHPIKGTGFSEDDLDLMFEALKAMFEHDRSAARGEMASRKLIVFRHAGALGSASASELFKRVKTWRVFKCERYEPGDDNLDNVVPVRSFSDYDIKIDRENLPEGVEIIERL
jgi:CRISPR-associated protein Csd2